MTWFRLCDFGVPAGHHSDTTTRVQIDLLPRAVPDSNHDTYLEQRGFKPECSLRIFDRSERRDLKRYGHWLQALADGTIQPESEDQEQFVDLVHNDERPNPEEGTGAYFADLWWRYQHRIEWEKDKAKH